jgi:hypothetical protein
MVHLLEDGKRHHRCVIPRQGTSRVGVSLRLSTNAEWGFNQQKNNRLLVITFIVSETPGKGHATKCLGDIISAFSGDVALWGPYIPASRAIAVANNMVLTGHFDCFWKGNPSVVPSGLSCCFVILFLFIFSLSIASTFLSRFFHNQNQWTLLRLSSLRFSTLYHCFVVHA